jgi:proline iminopeptidase
MLKLHFGLVLCPLLLVSVVHAQERFVQTSDGVKLYVNVRGSGTPCLYIHGGPGAGSYFLEKLVGESLEKRFQMIYLDQRGSGRSSSPADGNYSMGRMVRDFEEVRSALGIRKWVTLGHSFGGLLQMGYAKRCPDVIQGMVMINCTLSIKQSLRTVGSPRRANCSMSRTDAPFWTRPDPSRRGSTACWNN